MATGTSTQRACTGMRRRSAGLFVKAGYQGARYLSVSELTRQVEGIKADIMSLIASKIYNAEHGYNSTLKAVDNSLERFQFGASLPHAFLRTQHLTLISRLPRSLPDPRSPCGQAEASRDMEGAARSQDGRQAAVCRCFQLVRHAPYHPRAHALSEPNYQRSEAPGRDSRSGPGDALS